jgi:hypothetical protein
VLGRCYRSRASSQATAASATTSASFTIITV